MNGQKSDDRRRQFPGLAARGQKGFGDAPASSPSLRLARSFRSIRLSSPFSPLSQPSQLRRPHLPPWALPLSNLVSVWRFPSAPPHLEAGGRTEGHVATGGGRGSSPLPSLSPKSPKLSPHSPYFPGLAHPRLRPESRRDQPTNISSSRKASRARSDSRKQLLAPPPPRPFPPAPQLALREGE